MAEGINLHFSPPPPRPLPVATQAPAPSKWHQDPTIPGEVLNSYTERTPSEDGKYVKVIKHEERIELIKQPPTPEEIAAEEAREKEERAFMLKVLAGLGVGVVGFFAWLTYMDNKTRETVVKPAEIEPAE